MGLEVALGGALGLGSSLLGASEKRNQAKKFNQQANALREAGLLDFSQLHTALFGEEGARDRTGGLYGQSLQELLGVRPLLEQGYGQAATLLGEGLDQRAGQYRQSIDELRSGYGRARGDLEAAGTGTRQQIATQREQGVKQGTARAARQGLLTTSADLERSGRGDSQMALARLGETLAGLRSGLSERETQSVSGAQRGLGDVFGQGLGALAGLAGQKGQALGAHQASVSQALLDRANAYAQSQQAKANFRAGLPFQMHAPSSGAVAGAGLLGGLGGGLGIAAQQGAFNPQPSGGFNWGQY